MYIAVGKIVGTHSSKGFFKVIPYSGNPNRFLKLKTIYIEIDEEATGFIIEEIRLSKDIALIKLKGLENPENVKQFWYFMEVEQCINRKQFLRQLRRHTNEST